MNFNKNISLKALQWVDRLEDMARHHEERSHGALKTQEENLATHQKVQAWESYMLFSEFLFIIEPFFILSMIGLRHQTIAGMFPKKITHMGRKGPRAKTKTVLKSVSK